MWSTWQELSRTGDMFKEILGLDQNRILGGNVWPLHMYEFKSLENLVGCQLKTWLQYIFRNVIVHNNIGGSFWNFIYIRNTLVRNWLLGVAGRKVRDNKVATSVR